MFTSRRLSPKQSGRVLLGILFLATIGIGVSNAQPWEQKGLNIVGESAGDLSGRAISINGNGNVVAIGAPLNDDAGADAGQVRVFEWNGSAWIQKGTDIDGEAAGDRSGTEQAVSINWDGNTVAIGAPNNDALGTNTGHVRVYHWNGSVWMQQGGDIDGEAADDWAGSSVDLDSSGTTLAIGSVRNDGTASNAGHTRIYEWNGSVWIQKGIDINGEAAGDWAGSSVSLSANGDRIAIGAQNNDGTGSDAGHTRVYEWNGTAWTQIGSDINGEAAGDKSGACVSLSADGNTVAIGAFFNNGFTTYAGHTRVYQWSGTAWTQKGADIDGESVSELSGFAVSINASGDTLAVGDKQNDIAAHDAGRIRIFAWNGTSWIQQGNDILGSGIRYELGTAISINAAGNVVAAGAPYDGAGHFGYSIVYEAPCASYSTDSITACDSLTWINGITYMASDYTATDTLVNAAGCDSVVTLNLTVNYSSTATDSITACDSFTWINGITYTSSNYTATDTLINAAGCDSVVTLNLTVNYSSTAADSITACDSLTWINGVTYTASNYTATDTLINAAGCDSVVTLNLTVNYSSTATDSITACDSLTWINGITYTSSNYIATDTLVNATGCDSVITLNLTIHYSSTATDSFTVCNYLTWITGVTYTSSNYTATDTLINAAGCDSVVTLNLTVNYSSTATDSITACDSLTWINGVTYTSSNDTATDTLINAVGCDSVVTLKLNLGYEQELSLDTSVCDSLVSPSGKYTWHESATYFDTLTSQLGCNIFFHIDLVIDPFGISCESKPCPLFFPNVITPNSDGLNDKFFISDPCQLPSVWTLEIYNRWGQLVWSGNNEFKWDGQINGEPASTGTYFFIAKSNDMSIKGSFNCFYENQ